MRGFGLALIGVGMSKIKMTKAMPTEAGQYLHSKDGVQFKVVNLRSDMLFNNGSDYTGFTYYNSPSEVGGCWLKLDPSQFEFEG